MKLIAIDGNSLMHRAYYALPNMTNKAGTPTGALHGFLSMLLKLVDMRPDYLLVAFDMPIKTFRHEKYADYKKACENFWNYVVNNRSYAIGGNSIAEHFEAEGAETLGVKTCESCNTYNMMRLSEHLFAWKHDSAYTVSYTHLTLPTT